MLCYNISGQNDLIVHITVQNTTVESDQTLTAYVDTDEVLYSLLNMDVPDSRSGSSKSIATPVPAKNLAGFLDLATFQHNSHADYIQLKKY